MEIGAVFILVIVVIVVAVLGGGFYALTMWLRGKQLAPEGDQLEGDQQKQSPRPEHVEVENEQNARFVGTN
jgi:flagellar basal body-associated protein FliL